MYVPSEACIGIKISSSVQGNATDVFLVVIQEHFVWPSDITFPRQVMVCKGVAKEEEEEEEVR